MDDVKDLVLAPFEDIASKGRTAVENATDDDMKKTSSALVKEGERALRKIEPLCRKNVDEYGAAFVDALKENDELAAFRSELNDLLWDLDDFLEPDEFDADRVREVQAASRKAAPRIHDIITRMKLVAPPPRESSGHATPVQVASPTSVPSSPVPFNVVAEQLQASHIRQIEHEERAPPTPPLDNPWDPRKEFSSETVLPANLPTKRRAPLGPLGPLPADGAANATPDLRPQPRDPRRLTGHRSGDLSGYGAGFPSPPPASPPPPVPHDRVTQRQDLPSQRPRPSAAGNLSALSIPEDAEAAAPQAGRFSDSGAGHAMSPSRQPSIASTRSSGLFEMRESTLLASPTTDRTSYNSNPEAAMAQQPKGAAWTSQEQPGLIPVPIGQYGDSGPIVVPGPGPSDAQVASPKSPGEPRSPKADCTIGIHSSFYLLKGWCKGAEEVYRGSLGVKKSKRTTFDGVHVIGKCVSCSYEERYGDIELDVNKDEQGTLEEAGVRYRTRFLQKSHVATKRSDESLYGCVFCIQAGRTCEESDATVFISRKALFAHISRHARPLPAVPGITVVEEPEVPFNLANNFDLHLRDPQVPSPTPDTPHLPTATANQTVKRALGMRLLQDRTPAFEMPVGAKITGVEFIDKYGGEWCMGWYDGVRASFPLEVVKLEAPHASETRVGRASNTRAVARWKFSPRDKDKSDWLKFDKEQVITNISWPHPDHWCWSGTNAKGKWGIFHRSFIDPQTVQELGSRPPADSASVLSSGSRSERMKSKFSVRRQHGRPLSTAESTSSGEAPTFERRGTGLS